MGQRFQSVFILPSVYMNEGNPNNRNERALIFHNQWLYGHTALKINLMIMQRIKQAIRCRKSCGPFGTSKKGFINHFLEKSVNNATKWAGLQDLHNERYFHEPEEFEMGKEEKLSHALHMQDNNNGFFICMIDKDLNNIRCTFISGLEDTKVHELKTPMEYFRLFYSEEEYNKLGSKSKKVFDDYKQFEQIDVGTIKALISEMNNLNQTQKTIENTAE